MNTKHLKELKKEFAVAEMAIVEATKKTREIRMLILLELNHVKAKP